MQFLSSYAAALNFISACWGLFVVLWVFAAASTKRTIYRETTLSRLRYIVLLLAGYLITVYARRLPYPLKIRIVPSSPYIAWAAAGLCTAGLLFALWARATLGRNWSGIVTLKQDHELIERGPYALVRHPIYTGLLVMFLGTAIALGRLGGFIGVALVFFSFWIKLRDEERLMLSQFSDAYGDYQRRVKRLVPFIL